MVITRRSISRIAVFLLLGLAVAATVSAMTRTAELQETRPTASAVLASRQSVLFVGDSYTAGVGVQDARDSYPELVAHEANWDLHLDAQGSTGFIEDGRAYGSHNTSRLIDRLAADKQKFPIVDLLVVDGGRNDMSRSPDDIANAIAEYLVQAREQWPTAKIVAIFPAYVGTSGPFDGYPELLDRISGIVSAVGGILIDPIGEGWFSNVDPAAMTIQDGVHPDWRGNTYIADRLISAFRRNGILPET